MEVSVVLDTNVIVSKHLTRSPTSPAREIFDRWRAKEFTLLYQADILAEYVELLLRHNIAPATIRKFLAIIMSDGKRVKIRYFHVRPYPQDPDDIPFLLCALNGQASHLVSYDDHLLAICDPLAFLRGLRS